MCINANIYGDKAVDPLRDFAPVAKLATSPVIIVSDPATRIDTIADLVARARREPGKLAYSTPSVGTPTHVAAELLGMQADIVLLHVPYAGSGQLMTDGLSGEVPLSFALPGATQQFLASRQLKAMAVTSSRRIAALPDVPTVAESGFPGFEVTSWHSILAPAGTPPEIVARLNGLTRPHHPDAGCARALGSDRDAAVSRHAGTTCGGHQGGSRQMGTRREARADSTGLASRRR